MKLEYYNPIDEHGGCVIRAISKSLDKDYYIVKEELKQINENYTAIFEEYLLNNNFNIDESYKNKLLFDIVLEGNNVVLAHDNDWYHLICVIDNVIYDKCTKDELKNMKVIKVYKKSEYVTQLIERSNENIIIKDNIILRKLKDDEDDYKLLYKWCSKKEIYLYFEQRKLSYEEIKNKYKTRIQKNKVETYIIEYKNIPVGLIQYELKDNRIYNIDIFIGELDYHHKGIATNSINLLCEYLFKEKNANKLIMCPLKSNIKAVKCYEKCGFKIIKEYIEKDTIGKKQVFNLMIKRK